MDPWILWIGVFWLVVIGVTFGAIRIARPKWNLQRTSKAVGLPVSDEVRPVIESWQRRDVLSTGVAVLIGLGVGFVVLVLSHATGTFAIFWSYFLVLFVSIAAGAMVATVRNERKRQQTGVRFARARAVTRDDYQSKSMQWMPRVTVPLLVVGLVVRALITPNPARDIPVFLLIYAGVSVATVIVAEFACNWIVRRGQPAGSELELAWDDAFKSRSLYTLTYLPAVLGAFGGQVGSALALPAFTVSVGKTLHTASVAPIVQSLRFEGALLIQDLFGIAAILFLLIVILVATASKFQQRYLRRLWPELVAKQDQGEPAYPSAEVAARESKQ